MEVQTSLSLSLQPFHDGGPILKPHLSFSNHAMMEVHSSNPISLSLPYRGLEAQSSKSSSPSLSFSFPFSSSQDPAKTGVLAVQSLRNNIMASTLMASTAIMLCSLVAVLVTSSGGIPSAYANVGIRRCLTVKIFAILCSFLLAFLFEVQSVRYYSHASILINVPSSSGIKEGATAAYVAASLDRGAYFWSLGLRALYFSFPLFLWILGPVPMLVCSSLLVVLLYFLDLSPPVAEY